MVVTYQHTVPRTKRMLVRANQKASLTPVYSVFHAVKLVSIIA